MADVWLLQLMKIEYRFKWVVCKRQENIGDKIFSIDKEILCLYSITSDQQKHQYFNRLFITYKYSKMIGSIIAKEYKLVKKLGSGAFGEVFLAAHLKNHCEKAIKLEMAEQKSQQLFHEAKILRDLSANESTVDNGFPRVYECGSEGSYNLMVMDLFGQSLQDLFNSNGRKFNLKTTLMIGYQMIQRIQFIHSKSYIHRDVKPDNFVMGSGKNSRKLYMIDFGLAKRYIQRDGSHIPYKDNKNLTGTARYASLNTHLGIQQGRRDDIEGIAHVLLYFVKGSLPWQNLKANNKKEKYEKIMDRKLSIPLDKLCNGLPQQFKQLMGYCRNIEFEDKPDYGYLKELFKKAMEKGGIEMDYKYCWSN